MGLSCEDNRNYGAGVEPGVYLDQATILDVSELTDTQPKNFKKPIGLGIGLILEKEGLSFNPEIRIYGDPKVDDNGKIVGWGSAFPVKDVLAKVGGYTGNLGVGKNPKKIPDKVLLTLVGKTVVYLRYCYARGSDGKVRYATWKQVSSTEADLLRQWKQSRSKGFPRDFDPTLVKEPIPVAEVAF